MNSLLLIILASVSLAVQSAGYARRYGDYRSAQPAPAESYECPSGCLRGQQCCGQRCLASPCHGVCLPFKPAQTVDVAIQCKNPDGDFYGPITYEDYS